MQAPHCPGRHGTFALTQVTSTSPSPPAAPSLTDEGRAEYQALRSEIIERLRAQQQTRNYALLLLTATAAGSLGLAGRVEGEAARQFLGSASLLPLTVLALLFASLAAVFTEHEVMIAQAGAYIANVLGMPWEHALHGKPATRRQAASKLLLGALYAGKYLLAVVPATVVWGLGTFPVFAGLSVWESSGPELVVWLARVTWLIALLLILAAVGGIAQSIRTYWTIGPDPSQLDVTRKLQRSGLVELRRIPEPQTPPTASSAARPPDPEDVPST
jgi:hypothetical protein